MTTHLRLGVVAAIDPTSTFGVVAAEVLRHELGTRLGPVELDLRTTEPNTRPLERTPWLQWRASAWPHALDGLIVDARLASTIRSGDSPEGNPGRDPVVVETDLWATPGELVALFASQVDDVALDVRTRMLQHLGVLDGASGDPGTRATAIHIPLSALDRYAVAVAVRSDDPVESALAAGVGHDRSRAVGALDAIARQIGPLVPDRGAHEIHALRDRIAQLEFALAEMSDERAAWIEALDAAAATRLVLERRQDEATLSAAAPPASRSSGATAESSSTTSPARSRRART